jgi:hypothetical protein
MENQNGASYLFIAPKRLQNSIYLKLKLSLSPISAHFSSAGIAYAVVNTRTHFQAAKLAKRKSAISAN